jgi:hypothetical protein
MNRTAFFNERVNGALCENYREKKICPVLSTLFAALQDPELAPELALSKTSWIFNKRFDASRPSVKIPLTASSSAQ